MEPMRGDAFIHFVCGSQRVNIQLGVLLLIPKSPQTLLPVPLSLKKLLFVTLRFLDLLNTITWYNIVEKWIIIFEMDM